MLKDSLQALAMPFAIQHNLYEDFVAVEDELALEFDHWHRVVVGSFANKLTDQQLRVLREIDLKLKT